MTFISKNNTIRVSSLTGLNDADTGMIPVS